VPPFVGVSEWVGAAGQVVRQDWDFLECACKTALFVVPIYALKPDNWLYSVIGSNLVDWQSG
jgi:hypothetical protein